MAADTLEAESDPRTGSFRGRSDVCYGDASDLFEHGVLHGQLWEPVYPLAGRDFRPCFACAFFPAGRAPASDDDDGPVGLAAEGAGE